MVTFVVVVRLGAPSSVTRTLIVTICGPCASEGVQENWPVTGSIAAPIAALGARLNASVLVGTSMSVATTVNESVEPSSTDWFGATARRGALFGKARCHTLVAGS